MIARGMDKRKVCVFLILVGLALLCVLFMIYTLFYARPHANTTIQKGGHTLLVAPFHWNDPAVHS